MKCLLTNITYKYYIGGDTQIAWRLLAFPTLSSSLCQELRNAKPTGEEAQAVDASLAALSLQCCQISR